MRSTARILAVALLGLGATSCAGGSTASRDSATIASQHGSASTTAAPNFSTHKNDRDNDGDHNDDDEKVLHYGHAASPSDRRASVALVTRYFAVAAAENGAAACSMLVPFIAEAVAEQDGKSPPLLGKTCAVVMSKLFRLHHRSACAEARHAPGHRGARRRPQGLSCARLLHDSRSAPVRRAARGPHLEAPGVARRNFGMSDPTNANLGYYRAPDACESKPSRDSSEVATCVAYRRAAERRRKRVRRIRQIDKQHRVE